jgi:hypothetical protein
MVEFCDKIRILTMIIIVLLYLGLGIYAGHTADNNKPDENDSGLYMTSYILCIFQCVIYIVMTILTPCLIFNEESEIKTNIETSCPLLVNIYWMVVYFNYDISEEYNKYAEVQTITFLVALGVIFLSCLGSCIYCCYGGSKIDMDNMDEQSLEFTRNLKEKMAIQGPNYNDNDNDNNNYRSII